MTTLEFKWTVSRGRETYGYNICTLFVDGSKVAACNGGGYDMQGTSLGDWVARTYRDRLMTLTPDEMEEHSHWERAEHPRMLCDDVNCLIAHKVPKVGTDEFELPSLPSGTETCPHCNGTTRVDQHDGKRIDDGRGFYGLTFHDPNYNPRKAVIGADVSNRTLGAASGVTVGEAEDAGQSFGLERLQAVYKASSKVPTASHTVPRIDGACGFSSVQRIMTAIGLSLEYIPTKSRKQSLYHLVDSRKAGK